MERLKFNECQDCMDWDGYVTDCFENCMKPFEALEEFNRYKDLEDQRLLLKPPCSIGSDVYYIPSKVNYELNILNGHEDNNRVYHQKVAKIVFTEHGWYLECDKDLEYGTDHILVDKFYKETWFLDSFEAEEALKRMKRGVRAWRD